MIASAQRRPAGGGTRVRDGAVPVETIPYPLTRPIREPSATSELGELASKEPEDRPEAPAERLGESVNESRLSRGWLVDGEGQYDPQDQAYECQDDDNRKDDFVRRGSRSARAAVATDASVGQRYLTADSWWARSSAGDASSAGTTATLCAS